MRQAIALVLVLAMSSCCCRPMKNESYAQVPLTLSEAKNLEKDGFTVTVERQTQSASGGFACGHSALCVIVLPIVLYGALFPKQWDQVVVRKADEVTMVAEYETGGALIHAQHLVDGQMLETRKLELRSLGKKVYVDSAKLVPLPDGGTERVVLPLISQHDFIAEERALLAKEKDPARRAAAIIEASVQLEDEGLAFAIERLRDPKEDDQTKGHAIDDNCNEPLVAAAEVAPGPWTRRALAKCYEPGPKADAAYRELAQLACAPSTDAKLLDALEPMLSKDHPELVNELPKCPAGPRRALLALWLGQPADVNEVEQLLTSADGERAHRHLMTREPSHRAAMVKLVRDGRSTQLLLSRLTSDKTVLEPELLASLAEVYVKPKGFFSTHPRAQILRLFDNAARAPDSKTRTKLAREVLAKNDGVVIDAALLTLGETQRFAAVVKGMKAPVTSGTPAIERDLMPFALQLVGCPVNELVEVADGKKSTPTCGPRPGEQP